MATSKSKDKFANVAAIQPYETAAGTLAVAKFAFPFSIQDKMALVINRIEYWPLVLANLNSVSDYVTFGLIAAPSIVDFTNQQDPVLIDSSRVARYDYGAAASGELFTMPIIKDLSTLPSGGLLVAPSPLYGAVQSNGAAGVMGCWIKFFYSYMELATDEYWELVESRRIIGA